jgi:hypothetical protein
LIMLIGDCVIMMLISKRSYIRLQFHK